MTAATQQEQATIFDQLLALLADIRTDVAELQAENERLKLEAFAKDSSIGHLGELVDELRADIASRQSREVVMRVAIEHVLRVFKSMADRGAYPLELLPMDDTGAPSVHFLGKQGWQFLTDALAQSQPQPLPAAQPPQITDTQRLDFMIEREAYIVYSKSGMHQLWNNNRGKQFFILSGSDREWFATWREAIDAAMERAQKLGGEQS